jgi:hypothetical protein
LGINSDSTEAVNGYEVRLWIGLASYRVRFGVIGSDPLRYEGARLADRWAMVTGCWAAWGVAGWAEPVSRLSFGPLGLGKYKKFIPFPNPL